MWESYLPEQVPQWVFVDQGSAELRRREGNSPCALGALSACLPRHTHAIALLHMTFSWELPTFLTYAGNPWRAKIGRLSQLLVVRFTSNLCKEGISWPHCSSCPAGHPLHSDLRVISPARARAASWDPLFPGGDRFPARSARSAELFCPSLVSLGEKNPLAQLALLPVTRTLMDLTLPMSCF